MLQSSVFIWAAPSSDFRTVGCVEGVRVRRAVQSGLTFGQERCQPVNIARFDRTRPMASDRRSMGLTCSRLSVGSLVCNSQSALPSVDPCI